MPCRFRFALLLSLVVTACSTSTEPSALGVWGGGDASLTLTRAGATVTYSCGMGTIDANWTLAPDGRFSATGEHHFGGGPEPLGGTPAHPATYQGQVEGNHLTFTVTLTDLSQTLGPFVLLRGGLPVFERCV